MGKYFKYAVGEILLVVIGILIALQINNWNDERKLKQQEKTYYCKISEDLQTDITNTSRAITSLEERKKSARRLLTNLLKVQENKSVVMNDFLAAVRSYKYVSTKAAILDITSSGKLENLKNQDLKKQILQHYSEQDYAVGVIKDNDKQVSQLIFTYNSYTDLGIQELDLYKAAYGKELSSLLKSTQWQKNPKDETFKHLKDHMNMTMVVCQREQQLLTDIKNSAETLYKKLSTYCESDD